MFLLNTCRLLLQYQFCAPGFSDEEEKSSPWILAWHSQLGCGVLLLNINNVTEHQHHTRPLWDHDESRQKQARTLWALSDVPSLRSPHAPWSAFSFTATSHKPHVLPCRRSLAVFGGGHWQWWPRGRIWGKTTEWGPGQVETCGRTFQTDRIASAKALRWECDWHVWKIARRPIQPE